jgi:hypothetical protein
VPKVFACAAALAAALLGASGPQNPSFSAGRSAMGAYGMVAQNTAAKATQPAVRTEYPTFANGTPYSVARERLIQSGWQPASTAGADQCEENDARCKGRPEMQSCAGTGEGNCLFLWRRVEALIALITIGDPPMVTAVECRAGCARAIRRGPRRCRAIERPRLVPHSCRPG